MSEADEHRWRFQRGDEVVPRCTALEKLGGGNAYEAYVVFDERLFTPVVVKIVRPHLVEDSATLRGLRREVDMVGRLNHPVIVRGFHADVEPPRPYLALERLLGPRLSTLLRKHGTLPLEQLLPLALELSSALHYLREVGVVHLDVKPSNIIMGTTPRLIDLSIARDVDRAAELDHVVGTDRYLAPEQADPPVTGTPGPPADVWGLGAVMFESIAGAPPFPAGARDEDAAPAERWPQLVEDPGPLPKGTAIVVADLVLQCLARDPADRPEPAELFERLEPLVHKLPKPRLGLFRPTIGSRR